MTYGIGHVAGVALARPVTIIPGWVHWPSTLQSLYTYTVGAHLAHSLDFAAAVVFYLCVWPICFPAAAAGFDFSLGGWVSLVVAYNLVCEFTLVGGWHLATYGSQASDAAQYAGPLARYKFNPANQYVKSADVNHLRREVFLQTLGWLQAAALQCIMMRLFATRAIGALGYTPFFAGGGVSSGAELLASLVRSETLWNVACVAFVTYWRELHFYVVHRAIHPWSSDGMATAGRKCPWWDLGSPLYVHAHSWHHKSSNPGPWSGMSMHPIEVRLESLWATCDCPVPCTCAVTPLPWAHPFPLPSRLRRSSSIFPARGCRWLPSPCPPSQCTRCVSSMPFFTRAWRLSRDTMGSSRPAETAITTIYTMLILCV